MTDERLIDEAVGMAFLGRHEDAWEVLECLPPPDRVRPAVLAVRMVICLTLKRWEIGREVACFIGPGDELRHREIAGRFHLGHAIALGAGGDRMGAF